MTREEDCRVELGDRASFANKRNAQVFVSIHCNASENHKGNGIETYHTEQKGLEDKLLAEMIQKAVIEQTDAFDRGIKAADYTVIVRTTMPAVLIEVGFLTDEVEKNMLQDKEYQQKLAKGIVDGIVRYLNR
jgi:N-acetylmuramoyl-L-alanine amidase